MLLQTVRWLPTMDIRRCVILSCAHAFHTWINLTGLAIHSLQILCVTVSVGLYFAFIYAAVHTHHSWTSFFACVKETFPTSICAVDQALSALWKDLLWQWDNGIISGCCSSPGCSCPAKQQSLHESHFSYDWLVPPLANSTIPGLMAPVSGHLHAEG